MSQRAHKTIERHKAFVAEYIKHFDATRAYTECGSYRSKSRRVAQAAAARLLTNDNVISLLNEAIEARNARTHVDQDRVIYELARVGFAHLRSVAQWDDDGFRLFPSDDLSEDDSASVAEVSHEVIEHYSENSHTIRTKKRIKAHNKLDALDKLARHVGLYKADNQITVDFGIAEVPDDSTDSETWNHTVQQVMNGHSGDNDADAG